MSGDVQSAIRNKTTGGEPLAADVRGHMEPRFNADFGNVRVHQNAEAASLSNQLSARAFTYETTSSSRAASISRAAAKANSCSPTS